IPYLLAIFLCDNSPDLRAFITFNTAGGVLFFLIDFFLSFLKPKIPSSFDYTTSEILGKKNTTIFQ
ncbi:MAG: hypothetical protein LBH40_03900, partial [Alphaproteobacteria bacterium]|nr:hypothetical protein [Alphaproteobacteria bacterium]